MQDLSNIDLFYAYLDLEINSKNNIYRIGLVSLNLTKDFYQENLNQAYEEMRKLKNSNLAVCGHNFRRFDYPYLIEQEPQLSSWHIIDTLELSILAFPLQHSHKLNKDYKQSEYSSNNPLEDAQATRLLLGQQLEALLKKPDEVQQVYIWLLTCGCEDADLAYRQFFSDNLGLKIEQPAIEMLPETMLKGINQSYLQQLWSSPQTYDFDTRLCVAGLLAWNYECNTNESKQVFCDWLRHLNGFQAVLENLRPLSTDEFAISSYLEYFEIPSFRPLQEEAVQAIINNERPLVIMPTGGGKSLCYQLPAFMFHERHKALTVVISPLQALMADQVADLEQAGFFFATFINGNLSAAERRQRLSELRSGSKGLLYISPEQLRSMSIRALLEQRPPVLWVIDEAHCVSQWGHDFRPDYRYIPKFIYELYQERQLAMPLLALMTATATVAVIKDIKELFAQHELNINRTIDGATTRDNLTFNVIPVAGNKEQVLLNQVKEALKLGGSTLIYTTTRKNAQKLAELLKQSNIEAKYYHGKLAKEQKQQVLQEFKSGKLNVVTATCAFGMGINRKDVRAVIHHCMSANLEGYIQEAGRAGRDGEPAVCTLLFDPKDADTVFRLQSLSQLTEQDLKNVLISTRHIRDRTFGSARDDWFWVTTNEIFESGDFDEEFGEESEQQNTKIKAGLHYLEKLGLLERAENFSSFIEFELSHDTFADSIEQFEKYSRMKDLSRFEADNFERLIQAMHIAKVYCNSNDEPFPLDRLSDEAGISLHDLTARIRELQKAEVCSFEIPITFVITKGVRGDARNNHERIRQLEDELLKVLNELFGNENEIQINLRGLASRLDPDNSKKIKASNIIDILEGWVAQKWLKLSRISSDMVRLGKMEVAEHLPEHKILTTTVLEVLYQALGDTTGARLPLKYELGKLAKEVTQKNQLDWNNEELEVILLWLHQRKIIRLSDGLNLFQQSLKIRVIKNASVSTVKSHYHEVKAHYDEQTRRTHYMVQYGKLKSAEQRQQFVSDYFGTNKEEFISKYEFSVEDIIEPVLIEDYKRIIEPLNPVQKEIVLASDPTMAVIAGPGSGKTRTIVHRIAYLIKVKRVEPKRILVLAYNRNAVRELRLRLRNLIGEQASQIRVFTFHGLALSLLGRTVGEYRGTQTINFDRLLVEACELIEKGEEFEDADEDTQARRIQLLGKLEYIFVDEYQDVTEKEYRLIKAISGLNQSEDKTQSVQINLWVIGDDDQNVFTFQGADTRYILQFQEEYKAKRLLLNENYRSTENIIETANCLIQNNLIRCKQAPEEQVRIDSERQGLRGEAVSALKFNNLSRQAGWIKDKIQSWVNVGIAPHEIAILASRWDDLSPIRLLLERESISTYALKNNTIPLLKNRCTRLLINALQKDYSLVLNPEELVQKRFEAFFERTGRSLTEPTVKILINIARDLDKERGYGFEDIVLPISVDEILTAIFEFNENGESFLEDNSVLVTSCHGSKGLEFRKVILLGDGFKTNCNEMESERRLFYVAMTRAKEELIVCSTQQNLFVQQAGLTSEVIDYSETQLPQLMRYFDLAPSNVYLGYESTQNRQNVIKNLCEGDVLELRANNHNNAWRIFTPNNDEIGYLSKRGTQLLKHKGIFPGQFQFQLGEVTVRYLYHHTKRDDITGKISENWFVVIPQIRVCRNAKN
ncbi:RecQ family ATP-dependent DNA helicase [Nostoc sp. 'Peltigera membranacea cyanobiont' N6]|uniref:RecQ family ATP-dependent DNA helicase n=1 Tax=Nostoc sp. 'Peltigera membranacea cyanobiont' N6 TaxID=1261031 RepID=UPI000CF30822|nr:RecQ family ATP-dependent DNA helicase [Nostoc sp. 'Peltigera membranacea cyanobiont' N6]AVH64040.1 ATP-dependent DNA helicase RecQ [Nostoc sp. 'Peltigera membranacea cyanobiont' N6]